MVTIAASDDPKELERVLAKVRSEPMIFVVATGEPNACGRGCTEWIAGQGQFDEGAGQTDTVKRRDVEGATAMRINPRTLTATVKIKQVEITSQTKAIPTTTVVGELINNCANPTDMNMRITLRDGNGKVVSVDDQWCSAPNTPHNTPAGESCTFKNTQMVYGVTSVDFKLIEVRQWSERFIKSMKSGIEKN